MLVKRFSTSIAVVVALLVLGLVGCGLSPVPFDGEAKATKTETTQTETTKAEDAPGKSLSVEGDSSDVEVQTEAYELDGVSADAMMMGYDMPDYNTEEYDSVKESGFVSTASSPLSTVSADVDTASYANLRRMLFNGYKMQTAEDKKRIEELQKEDPYWTDDYYSYEYNVIPAGSVRIEEMLNYFNYGYDVPEGQEGFAVTARVGACPWNKDTELLVLGFATPHESTEVRSMGSNLVFLIDVSGSMDDPDKLPLLQSAFAELVEDLDENDRVSIVTYSGEEEVVLEGESGANHRAIMRAIRGLSADGSTNGEAGLRMAYQLAEDNFIEGGVNRIVMASDGDLNVGMTSESDLHDFVDQKRQSGVYLSVLGFGDGNYKDNKMETLADHGNGSYHYIDSEAEAKRVFGERLTANLIPFANDVKVQVEFNPAAVKGYRLIGYENRTMAAEDFKNDQKDAGEVGPESQFTVVYEIVRADSAMEIPVPELKYGAGEMATKDANGLLTAKLRYQPISGGEVQEQERVVTQDDWSVNPGDDWRFAAAVTEFGMLLRDSEYKGTSSFDSVRELVGQPTEGTRVEFLELVGKAQNN